MAKKKSSSGASDFLEILMLTCFMCAIFFGAWGSYLNYQKNSLLKQKDFELANYKKLNKLLKTDKSKKALTASIRRKDSQDGASSFRSDIKEIVVSAGNHLGDPDVASRGAGKVKGGIREDKANVDFPAGRKLADIVEFYGRLSVLKPHIRVETVNLVRARKGRNQELKDSWTNQMKIVSYIQVKKPKKAAKAN